MNENKEFIQLYFGDITKKKVDIIVNVLGRGWDFRSGTLSTSIIDKAGRGVLTELRYHRSFDKNDFIVTGGGRLFCKKIIHGVLHEWDGRDKNIQVGSKNVPTDMFGIRRKHEHALHRFPCSRDRIS